MTVPRGTVRASLLRFRRNGVTALPLDAPDAPNSDTEELDDHDWDHPGDSSVRRRASGVRVVRRRYAVEDEPTEEREGPTGV